VCVHRSFLAVVGQSPALDLQCCCRDHLPGGPPRGRKLTRVSPSGPVAGDGMSAIRSSHPPGTITTWRRQPRTTRNPSPPGRYSGEDAARLVTWFTRAERLCAAGKTLAATRAAAANCHRTTGQRSAAHWLAGVTGESVGNAVELLRLGETLESHPGVDEAYRTGRLSPSGAKAVAGAGAVHPNSEGE